jgi:DNA polymerase III delta subunit
MTVPSPTAGIIREIAHHIIECEPELRKIMTDSSDSVDALEHVIALSNNTIRIFVNYIEKLYILGRPLTVELAKNIYTNICSTEFERYTELLLVGNLPEAIKIFYALHDHGYSVIDIIETYFSFLKTTTILNEMQKYKIIALLCKYITIFHNVHEDEIELALFTNNAINEIKC